jgi:putative sterol carrier protein
MAEFPPSPIPPSEFFESFLPRAFADADVPESARQVSEKLGVRLEGEGGGEWVFEMRGGSLAVARAPRDDAAFTVVQSVKDWRGALWEGRGGAIGRQATLVFRPGERAAAPAAAGALGAAPDPAVLSQLKTLKGVIRVVVSGGEGGDWRVDFALGPGEIPAEPTTTLTIRAADADAMERGELNPIEAFMAGRIQVVGDMALMMQVQMIQMTAAAAAAKPPGSPA